MRTALDRLRCIEMLHNKLSTYQYLQDSLLDYDVSTDEKYRKAFKSFYVVRRDEKWCDMFFLILQQEKDKHEISFRSILEEVFNEAQAQKFEKTIRVESSYCSKLVATINPNLPVWDKYVLDSLGLKRPSDKDSMDRLDSCVKVYSDIKKWSSDKIRKSCFEEWRRLFDDSFPQFKHFTDIKKLDLFLWQYRQE